MKTTAIYQPTRQARSHPYPNSVTLRHQLNKLLDILLIAATCTATITILLFLLALG